MEGADNDDTPVEEGGTGRFSPGERYGQVYQINYLRCIFCGLCIEACPTRALTMTNFYELADHSRADLIFEKDKLLAPLQEGMAQPPHPMVSGMEERDYYQGSVDGATEAQPPHPMVSGMEERDYYQGSVDGATEQQRDFVAERERSDDTGQEQPGQDQANRRETKGGGRS